MSDPLSVAASIAGLLSLGLKSTEYLYQFYAAYRTADKNLARVADKFGDLLQSLQIIEEVVRTREWRADEQTTLRQVETPIERCKDVISVLEVETQKFKKETKSNLKETIIGAGRRVAYPFQRSTLEKLDEDLDDLRSNLSIALQTLQLKDQQNAFNELDKVKGVVKNAQAQHVADSVRQWLNAPDATVDYNNACNKRYAGTGQWFVQSSAFTSWLQNENSFLWLYGFAGCGKSVLCSTTIQHTLRYQRTQVESAVAFFFFTFGDLSKQESVSALQALLLQLCGQIGGLESELKLLKSTCNQGTPPVSTLLEYLRNAITRCRHVYILLDALDESPEETARAELLSLIEIMRQWNLPSLHLLVTSRDVPDIRSSMDSQKTIPNTEFVLLKNKSIDADIREYISHSVNHERDLQRWNDVQRQQIKDHLSQHANGVFRWVKCQLDPLKKCPQSMKHLQQCLQSLPKSLDKTYERMLCSITEDLRDDARRMLSLLCYSLRPLSVEEVIEGIAVDIDDRECYDEDRKLSSATDLFRICPALIDVISIPRPVKEISNLFGETDDSEDFNDVQVIRIGHFSVQEYLVSDRIKKGPAAEFAMSSPIQNARIAKVCLLYLSNEDLTNLAPSHQVVQQYPFAEYAAEHWPDHYRQADTELSPQLSKMITTLLTERRSFDHLIKLHDFDPFMDSSTQYTMRDRDYVSPVYYAAVFGLDHVLLSLLTTSFAWDVSVRGGNLDAALVVASQRGYEQTVQMLIDHGADANAQGPFNMNALERASDSGYEKVVQILLQAGAGVDDPSGYCSFALLLASLHGYGKVVRMLLDAGAEVNGQRKWSGSPLDMAIGHGHEEVVQMLLDAGADVNAIRVVGGVLWAASERGHKKMVQMLLEAGADVNVCGLYGDALTAASGRGYEEMVQMLLDAGADVDSRGGWYGTALQTASRCGHEKVVKVLLDNGANVNAPIKGDNESALQGALMNGYERVVQMLLNAGAVE